MWEVKIEDQAAKILDSTQLSEEDRVIIREWARFVRRNGPDALKNFPQIWADHPLHDQWKGFRSSSFSYLGRIIYKVDRHIVTVVVVKITPDHDYKK
jgi:mRNA-degrading endonuclease RelE of RelBE toxin-antitoxin system